MGSHNVQAAGGPQVEPPGNRRVLGLALGAFSVGFGIWAMFAALGPFLIEWYGFTPGQVMLLAAMEPLGAMLLSLPLGIMADRFGGRIVMTGLMVLLGCVLMVGLLAQGFTGFLLMGFVLGLGGGSFVVGNAHVASWYPHSRQGVALGIFALGNAGILLGMILVPLLVTEVLGGPAGAAELPAKVSLGPIDGFYILFVIFAAMAFAVAAIYWKFTSEPPGRRHEMTFGQIARVYRTSRLAWIIAYLYFVSFGALVYFAASMPTYLVDRWNVGAIEASMLYTSLFVVCVAGMRPVGGLLADRHDPLRVAAGFLTGSLFFSLLAVLEASLTGQIIAFLGLALTSGAAAAAVLKLIPKYFDEVGAVSGLAKAAGAACGFTMTTLMALSRGTFDSFVPAFIVWAVMVALALWITLVRSGFAEPVEDALLGDATQGARLAAHGATPYAPMGYWSPGRPLPIN